MGQDGAGEGKRRGWAWGVEVEGWLGGKGGRRVLMPWFKNISVL